MQFFLTAIFPRIRGRHPKARLSITGEYGKEHRRLLGLEADAPVELTGRLPDIRRQIGRSAVCVVPLRVGGGTRVKILQAVALGTPVVATTKGAEGLQVQHGRHLLLADSAAEFSDAVCRLLDDGALREQIILNAQDLVRVHFDWPQCFAPLDILIDDSTATSLPLR